MSHTSNSMFSLGRILVVSLVLVGAGTAVMNWTQNDAMPEVPASPADYPVQLVSAQTFTLDQPYTHWYRADQPKVDAGMLLVLKVDEVELLHPRQTAQPVLQVGTETAEPLNIGHLSGYVIALLPAQRLNDGVVDLDLSTAPIFYGEASLAERLDGPALQARLQDAMKRGAQAPSMDVLEQATGESLHFANDHALRLWAADMIATWSPQEEDLVEGMRVPLLGQ